MPTDSWVDLVGYQLEAVHDGAAKALLEDKRWGGLIASRMLGEPVEEVLYVRKQSKVGQAVADLRVNVRLGGREYVIGIETKVDSRMTIGQLERTAADGDRVVLLCLGVSAMQTCTVTPLRDSDTQWRIIDIDAWFQLLAGLELPPLLASYREAVAAEAREHQQARAIAGGEARPEDFDPRHAELVDWSWLDETWRALRALTDPGRFTAHKDVSGPIFYWEDSAVPLKATVGHLYLDLMATGGRRQIVLKAAGVPAAKRRDLHAAVAEMNIPDTVPPARRALASNTFTVRVWDLTELPPRVAAEVALAAQEATKCAARRL